MKICLNLTLDLLIFDSYVPMLSHCFTRAGETGHVSSFAAPLEAMRMQTALQSSSVSAETEDASAGDWTAEESLYGSVLMMVWKGDLLGFTWFYSRERLSAGFFQ